MNTLLALIAATFTLVRTEPPETLPADIPVPSWSHGEADTNHIDLLIVFDASANKWLSETRKMSREDFAALQVNDLNRSLAYTELDKAFQFRLAGTLDLAPLDLSTVQMQSITDSFNSGFLKKLDNGTIAKVKMIRDIRNADVVAFFTISKEAGVYGYGVPMQMDQFSEAGFESLSEHAYCTCAIDTLEQRRTLFHEIGHILGAGHSDTQLNSRGPQLFPWSSAYRFSAGMTPLTTVVGYPTQKDGVILPFYSSPNYKLTWTADDGTVIRDIAIGTPTNDNTRTVLATYPLVAQYRVAKPTEAAKAFFDGLTVNVDTAKIHRVGVAMKLPLNIESRAGAFSITVRNLPKGLSFNKEANEISGAPSDAGTHIIRLAIKSEADNIVKFMHFKLEVQPLPGWAVNTYKGVTREGESKANISLTISTRGAQTLTKRTGLLNKQAQQREILSERTGPDGQPEFQLMDGMLLVSERGADGRLTGIVRCQDGTILRPDKKASRRTSAKPKKEKKARKP